MRAGPEELEQDGRIRELEKGFEAKLVDHMEGQTKKLQEELKRAGIRFRTGEIGQLAISAVFRHAVQNTVVNAEHGQQPVQRVQIYSPMGYALRFASDPEIVKQIVARHMDELHAKVTPLVEAHNKALRPILG